MVVDVDTDDADSGLWLAEFLAPWAGVTVAGAGAARVRLTHSSDVVDALECRRASGATELMPCFALDHETVSLPGWVDDGRTWMADDDMECFYGVRGSRVDVVGREGKRRVRLGLMRVVREILCQGPLDGRGHLDVHASAFAVEGRAALLVGRRGAGKTTLLCHALASGRAGFVANDRVLISAGRQPAEARGVPTVVSLRPGTVEAFPRLRLREVEHPVILHVAEPEPAHPDFGEKRRDSGNLYLTPAQCARRLGAECVPGGRLESVLFPELSASDEGVILEPLAEAAGLSRMLDALYGPSARYDGPTVFGALGGRWTRATTPGPGELAGSLGHHVRFYRCRLGTRAYQGSAETWFAGIGFGARAGVHPA